MSKEALPDMQHGVYILQNLNLLFLLPCSRVCGWNIGVRYKTPIFPSCQLSFGEIEVFLIVDCGTL